MDVADVVPPGANIVTPILVLHLSTPPTHSCTVSNIALCMSHVPHFYLKVPTPAPH